MEMEVKVTEVVEACLEIDTLEIASSQDLPPTTPMPAAEPKPAPTPAVRNPRWHLLLVVLAGLLLTIQSIS